MNEFYALVGRLVIHALMARYRPQVRAAAAAALLAGALGGFLLLKRDVAEG
jgi:hypothetical protein